MAFRRGQTATRTVIQGAKDPPRSGRDKAKLELTLRALNRLLGDPDLWTRKRLFSPPQDQPEAEQDLDQCKVGNDKNWQAELLLALCDAKVALREIEDGGPTTYYANRERAEEVLSDFAAGGTMLHDLIWPPEAPLPEPADEPPPLPVPPPPPPLPGDEDLLKDPALMQKFEGYLEGRDKVTTNEVIVNVFGSLVITRPGAPFNKMVAGELKGRGFRLKEYREGARRVRAFTRRPDPPPASQRPPSSPEDNALPEDNVFGFDDLPAVKIEPPAEPEPVAEQEAESLELDRLLGSAVARARPDHVEPAPPSSEPVDSSPISETLEWLSNRPRFTFQRVSAPPGPPPADPEPPPADPEPPRPSELSHIDHVDLKDCILPSENFIPAPKLYAQILGPRFPLAQPAILAAIARRARAAGFLRHHDLGTGMVLFHRPGYEVTLEDIAQAIADTSPKSRQEVLQETISTLLDGALHRKRELFQGNEERNWQRKVLETLRERGFVTTHGHTTKMMYAGVKEKLDELVDQTHEGRVRQPGKDDWFESLLNYNEPGEETEEASEETGEAETGEAPLKPSPANIIEQALNQSGITNIIKQALSHKAPDPAAPEPEPEPEPEPAAPEPMELPVQAKLALLEARVAAFEDQVAATLELHHVRLQEMTQRFEDMDGYLQELGVTIAELKNPMRKP